MTPRFHRIGEFQANYGTHIAAALAENNPSWFAVVTKPRHEKSVAAAFRAKGIPEFLPQYHARRRWSDRTKTIEVPLFPGYVFCRFVRSAPLAVRQTPGVVDVVGFGGKPEPVDESEIVAVQLALRSGRPVQRWPYLTAGDHVRIDYGPLAGVTGIMVREKGELRVVVSIELLQRSIAVDIERECIGPAFVRERRAIAR